MSEWMRKHARQIHPSAQALRPAVESTSRHYRVLHDGKLRRKTDGMPFTCRSRSSNRSAVRGQKTPKPADLSVTGLRRRHVLTHASSCQANGRWARSRDAAPLLAARGCPRDGCFLTARRRAIRSSLGRSDPRP